MSIEEVLKKQTGSLMTIPGVTGTGQGLYHGNPCIKVFVAKLNAELKKQIPDTIEGYPVIIEETGRFISL
ncbi:MAG: hypothetical protein ABR519_01315 [Bacteroidales bacterium]